MVRIYSEEEYNDMIDLMSREPNYVDSTTKRLEKADRLLDRTFRLIGYIGGVPALNELEKDIEEYFEEMNNG